MLLLAKRVGAVVYALPGGSLERKVSELGLRFAPLSFWSLLKFEGVFLTVRSSDTLMALLASLVNGSKVVRLDFVLKSYPWDRFLKKIPVYKLGWIRVLDEPPPKKRSFLSVAVVSRLKPGRRLEGLLEKVSSCKLSFLLYIIGGGDASILGSPAKDVRFLWIRRKVLKFRRLLGSMDLLLYTSAGTDKTCRAVLEAMEARVAVATMEPLSYRYVDKHTGFRLKEPVVLEKILSVPLELKRRGVNARRRASFYDYMKVEVPL